MPAVTRFWAIVAVFLFWELLAGWCLAASVKVCYDDLSVAGAASVQAVYHPPTGADVTDSDVLAGGVVAAGKRCTTHPIPSALVRGTTYSVTLHAVNAFQEVGPASNAVTFLPPTLPGVVTGFTVQIVVP